MYQKTVSLFTEDGVSRKAYKIYCVFTYFLTFYYGKQLKHSNVFTVIPFDNKLIKRRHKEILSDFLLSNRQQSSVLYIKKVIFIYNICISSSFV